MDKKISENGFWLIAEQEKKNTRQAKKKKIPSTCHSAPGFFYHLGPYPILHKASQCCITIISWIEWPDIPPSDCISGRKEHFIQTILPFTILSVRPLVCLSDSVCLDSSVLRSIHLSISVPFRPTVRLLSLVFWSLFQPIYLPVLLSYYLTFYRISLLCLSILFSVCLYRFLRSCGSVLSVTSCLFLLPHWSVMSICLSVIPADCLLMSIFPSTRVGIRKAEIVGSQVAMSTKLKRGNW